MDPKLQALLAQRRTRVEPEEPSVDISDEALLAQMEERERQKAAAIMSRVCNSMLTVAGGKYPDVYPLQDDSRFFMQTILDELDGLTRLEPALAVEVGCGAAPSGVLLSRLLPSTAVLGTDISLSAMGAAAENAANNKTVMHLARMDLLAGLRPGTVDLLVFLAPYVPTSGDKLTAASASALAATQPVSGIFDATWLWAGGPNGTALVERFVRDDLERVLSPDGVALLLFSASSESVGMIERASKGALTASVVARCNDPTLGDKMRVCVVRVERSADAPAAPSSKLLSSMANVSMSASCSSSNSSSNIRTGEWREQVDARTHKEESRQPRL